MHFYVLLIKSDIEYKIVDVTKIAFTDENDVII